MIIAIASDHAGFLLKQSLKNKLSNAGHALIDLGAHAVDRVDYPDYAALVAQKIQLSDVAFGILICGSGIGMSIAANRFSGIRAVVLRDDYDAQMSRAHNNANIACLGERVTDLDSAFSLCEIFLTTPFDGGRHQERIKKIDTK